MKQPAQRDLLRTDPKRIRRATAVLTVMLLATGCAPVRYIAARGRDLADCFQLNGGFSLGLSAQIKATDLVHLHPGFSMDKKFGFVGRYGGVWEEYNSGTLALLPCVPLGFDGSHPTRLPDPRAESYLNARTAVTGSKGLRAEVQDWCNVVHVPSLGEPKRPWIDRFDLEVGATALVANARVGFSPGQVVDFLVGIIGFDPAGDDHPKE